MTAKKPTKLALLQGNPGRRKINTDEPSSNEGIPNMPSHLTDHAVDFWNRTTKALDGMGIMSKEDVDTLASIAVLYKRMRDLQSDIDEHGNIIKTINVNGDAMLRANPAVTLLQKDETTFRALMSDFGLSPVGRSRIVVNKKVDTSDPLKKYKA